MTSPCLAEQILCALIVHQLREGALSEADALAMADGLPDEAAHLLRALIVEAAAPNKPRKRLRLVHPDGGN